MLFIVKEGASNYYVKAGSMGSFLCPPEHANKKYHIIEKRGGHEVGSCSIEFVANEHEEGYFPLAVKRVASRYLKDFPGDVKNEEWIKEVYRYFKNCYSDDGINRDVSDCVINTNDHVFPQFHLGYLCIKSYDPEHEIRYDLM